MNEYRFCDLSIGMEESFCREITEEMMAQFLAITNDINPLHKHIEYALEKGFKGKVVYGMLTASLISTLGGVYLPGKYCLIHGVEIKFLNPVYIGDNITVTGKVVELHESVEQMTVKVMMKNQCGQVVCRGKLKAGVLHE